MSLCGTLWSQVIFRSFVDGCRFSRGHGTKVIWFCLDSINYIARNALIFLLLHQSWSGHKDSGSLMFRGHFRLQVKTDDPVKDPNAKRRA